MDVRLDKRRIAKNTLLLYVRMFATIIIGLYTSRITLKVLGIDDYGVYNIVGGIVSMLAFLNMAMTASSQRFISYELGTGNFERLKKVFVTSVNIHVAIALLVLLISETCGLWFVNTQLNIPFSRIEAANWVYQFSIFTFVLTVISVPYNACIVAHEHMKAFAYISIIEVALKLISVLLLTLIAYDKLIVYAIFVFLISLVLRFSYACYCKKHFNECNYRFCWDSSLFKSMLSFSGWSLLGNLGFSFRDQLSNIILNLFFGPAVNAARGIAMQVSGMLTGFAGNFTMAINPQITKQYASGHHLECLKLIYISSRFSFYLLCLVCVPVFVNIDYILDLWLEIVPGNTSEFIILSLLASLLYTLSGPVTIGLQATGRIRLFQIGVSVIMLSELPLAYVLLKEGYPPVAALYPGILSNFVALFFRFFLLKRYVPESSFSYYIRFVVARACFVLLLSWGGALYIKKYFSEDSFVTFISTSCIAILITLFVILILGVTGKERSQLKNKVISRFF